MDPDFWRARWRSGKIGFHRPEIHRALAEHGAELKLGPESRVLVPLAGKSLDVGALAEAGADVVAVELVETAALEFFAERGETPERREAAPFTVYRHGRIEFWIGDFFRFVAGPFDASYDRAALVALPPAKRRRYAEHVLGRLKSGGRILLVTCEYDETRMEGPPFSVPSAEVRALFEDQATVEQLAEHETIDESPNLKARGLESVREQFWRIEKR